MFLHKNFKWLPYLQNFRTSDGNRFTSSSTSSSSSQNAPVSNAQKPVITTIGSETFGQPTSLTHPHLINEGELVPGISIDEFHSRRQRLMNSIRKLARNIISENHLLGCDNHIVVIPSATKKYMSDNIPYVFRQKSDFLYLTGCLEPDTILMMTIDECNSIKSTLFMRPKDKHSELWEGPRTGVDAAPEMFGVDEAYTNDQFRKYFSKQMQSEKPHLWYDEASADNHKITTDIHSVVGSGPRNNSPSEIIQSMRLFKSGAEQELMRRTCKIASQAINEVMEEARPGQSEHHLFAMVDYKCRMNNASHLAYPPVVASGNNATVIHYINNCQLMKPNHLVLMDAGCEYGGYTSDITRTWPISGTFTEPQKILYDVVLHVQRELIECVLKEGGDTLDHLFDTMCIKLGKYLQEAGIVTKHISNNKGYAQAGYKFCPHHVSHYLGMDVHDTPMVSRNLQISPGMVFTIEPGIYIGQDRTDVPKEFREGIGIRIEDDILITPDNKVEVLTSNCVKERSELENLFKRKPNVD